MLEGYKSVTCASQLHITIALCFGSIQLHMSHAHNAVSITQCTQSHNPCVVPRLQYFAAVNRLESRGRAVRFGNKIIGREGPVEGSTGTR